MKPRLIIMTAAAAPLVVALGTYGLAHASSQTAESATSSSSSHASVTADPRASILSAATTSQDVPQGPPFPTNASGQTYGAIPDQGVADADQWPDLVAVYIPGTDGDVGYITKAAMGADDQLPANPTDALRRAATAPVSATIYAADGKTVLGSIDFPTG